MNDDLISRSALIENFESRLALCNEWIEKAKDKETKIRADATKHFICEVIMTIDNAQPVNKKPFVSVTFDKDELDQIVEERVIEPIKNGELVIKKERPRGEWDYEKVAFYGVCSNCGVTVTSNLADMFLYEEIREFPHAINFCPNCGADMRKEAPDV